MFDLKTEIAIGSASEAKQSDLKGHSEQNEESRMLHSLPRALPRGLRLATTLRVGLPRTLRVLAMTDTLKG